MSKKLISQLQTAGASPDEAKQLAALATKLGELGDAPVVPRHRFGWPWPVGTALATAIFVAAVVVFSMPEVPGQALFPVKRMVESAEMHLAPGERIQIMMERSQEVNQLVAAHRSSGLILSALKDYNQAASGVSEHGSYPAWEYCSRQLEQAWDESSGQVRTAISQSIVRFHLRQT